ncbi:hypothetical protein EMA8858_04172 [Emticicia aquatica]|uniref:Uncharacterized protein n=1 Tax=Emticicia aquatica TaxID=1681835 RepID=A0ABM9AW33_9BACT|nr:hypothetical protein EMA8858_04172 [Emticicia aquatica]
MTNSNDYYLVYKHLENSAYFIVNTHISLGQIQFLENVPEMNSKLGIPLINENAINNLKKEFEKKFPTYQFLIQKIVI